DSVAGRAHRLHSDPPAWIVPTDRPRRGGQVMESYRWFPSRSSDRGETGLLFALVLLAAGVPILNLWVPASSGLHLSTYGITLIGKYLCYAMLALSVDLIWGYCGILSLGQGAFFALGGYAMGMYLMRQIGTRGVYGDPVLPDFMVFLNWKSLPWFWHG